MRAHGGRAGLRLFPFVDSTGRKSIALPMEARSIGAIVATRNDTTPSSMAAPDLFARLLFDMSLLSAQPLAVFNDTWHYLPQQRVADSHARAPPLHMQAPAGAIQIPASPDYHYMVRGVEVESSDEAIGFDVQYEWGALAARALALTMRSLARSQAPSPLF